MRIWQGAPDRRTEDDALAAFGLVRDAPAEDVDFEIWPEHWIAAQLFLRLLSQWRYGPRGRAGLDYAAVAALFVIEGLPLRRRRVVLEQVRVMEAASLEHWAQSAR